MEPAFKDGQLVIGTGLFGSLKKGQIVIINHNKLEKIKRVSAVSQQTIEVLGDNPSRSTDSRKFGAIPKSIVVAKVIYPRR